MMRAVLPLGQGPGGATKEAPPDGRARLGEVPEPRPGPGEVLLAVRATALNRADLLQLRGLYPPPPGEPVVPGLECAGEVAALGDGVEAWRPGDRAAALLGGGGHAERVAAPAGQLLRLPDAWSFSEGAALPEAALTAWTNLVAEGRLAAGETVVITGATGGVGSFAVQLARELGARVVASARDRDRLERLAELGIEHRARAGEELTRTVAEATGGAGADLVLDLVGGPELGRHLALLRTGGRLVLVGLMAGARAELDLAALMRRRLRLVGSVLRARPRPEKAALVAAFEAFAAERLRDGRLRPVIHRVLPFEHFPEAYAALEAGGVFGKIVVELG